MSRLGEREEAPEWGQDRNGTPLHHHKWCSQAMRHSAMTSYMEWTAKPENGGTGNAPGVCLSYTTPLVGLIPKFLHNISYRTEKKNMSRPRTQRIQCWIQLIYILSFLISKTYNSIQQKIRSREDDRKKKEINPGLEIRITEQLGTKENLYICSKLHSASSLVITYFNRNKKKKIQYISYFSS
jgi:hypothetical protein